MAVDPGPVCGAGGCWLSFPCIKTDRRTQALIQLIFPLSLQSGALDYGIVCFLYSVNHLGKCALGFTQRSVS